MSIIQSVALLGASGQGPSADLGDTIEQSLRFRGGQFLDRAISGTLGTHTISFWCKIADNDNGYFFSFVGTGAGLRTGENNSSGWNLRYNNAANLTTEIFRDFSAWYHVVLSQDSTTAKVYVNNIEVISTNDDIHSSTTLRIGRDYGTANYYLNGYMAEFHFIDGQALNPTDFGKYNEDGVWVPQTYTGGNYGTNGAHLTFDSSQTNAGIGEDSAPIGASGHTARNDFTASGFDEGDIALYSKDLVSGSGTYISGRGPAQAFNGAADLTVTNACWAGGGAGSDGLTWSPDPEISFTSSLRVFTQGSQQDVSWDGNTVSNTQGWNSLVSSGSGTISASKPVTVSFSGGQTSTATIAAIEIDGTILVDNFDNDVDYLDTPTSNYATLNPLDPFAGGLTNANLAITTGTSRESAPGTIGTNSGKFYVELNCDQPPTNPPNRQYALYLVPASGMTNSTPSLSAGAYEVEIISGTNFKVATNNSNVVSGTLSSVPAADFKIQVLFNAGTRQLYCGIDNENWLRDDGTISSTFDESEPTIVLPEPDSGVYTIGSNIYNGTGSINYGQMPFQYTPPTGFSALQTNNLPEPTIKNGKDHFETVIWTGDGTSPRTISTEFQPDFVWVKSRSHANAHTLYDSVRGFGANKELVSDGNNLEGNTSNPATQNNGYVSGVTASGFTVTAGAGGEALTNTLGRTYVAWCWKGGGTAVSNTDGTITSSVSANTDAGFSIVSYTGSGSNGTIGHGLTEAPDLVIYKRRNATNDWIVYSSELLATEYLILNQAFDKNTGNTSLFNSLRPTNSVLNVGTSGSSNALNQTYIAYCWHSVENFSKAGSYEGNGSTDGPMVFTNHKPSWVIIKSADSDQNWVIYDATRSPNNPNSTYLFPNDPASEPTNNRPIDLLSNGFKIRDTANQINTNNTTYIYFSIAENPFGGENAPPATAR